MPHEQHDGPPTVLPADVAGVVMGYACTTPHEALQAALVSSSWHQAFLCCADDMWDRFDMVPGNLLHKTDTAGRKRIFGRTRFIVARSNKKLRAHVDQIESTSVSFQKQQCWHRAAQRVATENAKGQSEKAPKQQVVMKPNELHPIEDCDFAFRCPIFAERLKPTSRMSEFGMPILHCDVCTRDVFVVESQEQVDYCRSNGQCVRFDKKHTDPSYCAQANVLILDAEGGSAAVQVALGILLAAAEQRQQAQTSSPLLGKRQPAVSEPYQLRLVSPTLSSPLVVDVINTDSVNRHSRSSRFCIALGTVSSESVIPSDVATIRTLSDLPEEDGDRVHKRIFSMVSFAAHDTGKLTRNVDANFCSTRRYTRNAGDANPFNPIVVPPLSDVSYGPDTTSPNSSSTAKNKSEELAQLFKNFLNTITPNRKSKKKIVPTDTDTQLIRCRMETIAAGKAAIQRMYQDLHAPVVTGGIIMPSATLSSRPF